MKTINKLWLVIVMLALLAPLGIILPQYFRAGSAWGEWGAEDVKALVGYIPSGLAKLSLLWNSPVPDYVIKGWENKPMIDLSLAYVISAFIGIIMTVGVTLLISVLLKNKDKD